LSTKRFLSCGDISVKKLQKFLHTFTAKDFCREIQKLEICYTLICEYGGFDRNFQPFIFFLKIAMQPFELRRYLFLSNG